MDWGRIWLLLDVMEKAQKWPQYKNLGAKAQDALLELLAAPPRTIPNEPAPNVTRRTVSTDEQKEPSDG